MTYYLVYNFWLWFLQGSSSQLFMAMEKVSNELGEIKKIVLDKESEEKKDGYWTRVAKKIDKIFSILYVLAAILFLSVVFSVWLFKSYLPKWSRY